MENVRKVIIIAKIVEAVEAVKLVRSGDVVMIGGFGNVGNPKRLIDLLADTDIHDLTVIANDLGTPNVGLGRWVRNRMLKKAIGTYFTYNTEAAELYFDGKLNLEMMPQGTFAESIRAGGCGIGGFYTKVGAGTELTAHCETKVIDGEAYVLAYPLKADVALLHARKADAMGNLVYEKTARNFNPLMATAAALTIVEVDEIVETGMLSPEEIVTPYIYVDVLVPQGGAFLIQKIISGSDPIIPAVIFGKILLMGSQKFQRLFKRLPFSNMCNGNICLGQFAVQFRGALLGRNRFQGVDYLLRFILFKPLLALFQ